MYWPRAGLIVQKEGADNDTCCLLVGTRVRFVASTTSHDRPVNFAHGCFHALILYVLCINSVAKMKRTPVFQTMKK